MPTIKEKLAMSFKTITEMLDDRGILTDEDKAYMHSLSGNELFALMNKGIFNLDLGTKIRIIYYLNKFKMAEFRPHLEKAQGFDLCILIVADKLTTANTKNIQAAKTNTNADGDIVRLDNLHVFELSEVLFNITKHVLVPHHHVIADEVEINDIVKRYNIKNRHQLPIILKTDPVARYFGMKPGQLARITRVSPSAGEYISYRCCV